MTSSWSGLGGAALAGAAGTKVEVVDAREHPARL